ncbi:DUF5642 family protein [Mycobacterium sp. 21AC1]|uniref:DUF5642 family protein n=1 Tax=[Mycobacterium] appelbergii TaxID=2939269 RepID=UPI00293914DC|nr:DUF5642 family protein [Mycobacterium sp. 21AC1]MDV3129008.1 DUF5642 family protein [Mycobacterium sp. 21AC1]
MRVIAAAVALALGLTACGQPPAPNTPSTPGASSTAKMVNPARIDRVRADLPAGYEVAEIDRRATPVSLWGFGPNWSADPADCATVAAPAVDTATGRGWSASGAGGIVYAVVTRAAAPPDPALADECEQWTVSGGHATGTVNAITAPAIDGAVTSAMATAVTTVVEGGTETRSHADTFTADLGDYHCFVTVITDPGSPNPPLSADFAADLLVKTVSALRG